MLTLFINFLDKFKPSLFLETGAGLIFDSDFLAGLLNKLDESLAEGCVGEGVVKNEPLDGVGQGDSGDNGEF